MASWITRIATSGASVTFVFSQASKRNVLLFAARAMRFWGRARARPRLRPRPQPPRQPRRRPRPSATARVMVTSAPMHPATTRTILFGVLGEKNAPTRAVPACTNAMACQTGSGLTRRALRIWCARKRLNDATRTKCKLGVQERAKQKDLGRAKQPPRAHPPQVR